MGTPLPRTAFKMAQKFLGPSKQSSYQLLIPHLQLQKTSNMELPGPTFSPFCLCIGNCSLSRFVLYKWSCEAPPLSLYMYMVHFCPRSLKLHPVAFVSLPFVFLALYYFVELKKFTPPAYFGKFSYVERLHTICRKTFLYYDGAAS